MHNIAELFILGLDYGYCTNLLSNLGIHQGIGRQKTSHSASFNWEWEVLYFVSRKTWVFVFIDDWRWLAAIELNHKIWRSKQQLLLYHCAGYSKLRGGLSIGKRVGEGSKGRSDALWLRYENCSHHNYGNLNQLQQPHKPKKNGDKEKSTGLW